MKNSLYRKIMLGNSIISIVLLLVIANNIGVFDNLTKCTVWIWLDKVFTNTYVASTLCSIIAVIIIYILQVSYSKRMLKKDFRCNEIIEDVYYCIELYMGLADKIPQKTKKLSNEKYSDKMQREALKYYEFYKENKIDIEMIAGGLTYYNNEILIESVQSCFFINLNFKLLGIVNNIKNRLPNIKKEYPEIKELYEKYEKEKDDSILEKLWYKIPSYLIDLRFMVQYWKELLDYLGYDPTFTKVFLEAYRLKYDDMENLEQTEEVRNRRVREVVKEVKKKLIIEKLKNIWHK